MLVLGSEIGSRWNDVTAQHFVRDLVRLRRNAASSGWARRWWVALSVAVQLAVAWGALRRRGLVTAPHWTVLDLAADGPSRLPLRP